jgi:hypothetical protein
MDDDDLSFAGAIARSVFMKRRREFIESSVLVGVVIAALAAMFHGRDAWRSAASTLTAGGVVVILFFVAWACSGANREFERKQKVVANLRNDIITLKETREDFARQLHESCNQQIAVERSRFEHSVSMMRDGYEHDLSSYRGVTERMQSQLGDQHRQIAALRAEIQRLRDKPLS